MSSISLSANIHAIKRRVRTTDPPPKISGTAAFSHAGRYAQASMLIAWQLFWQKRVTRSRPKDTASHPFSFPHLPQIFARFCFHLNIIDIYRDINMAVDRIKQTITSPEPSPLRTGFEQRPFVAIPIRCLPCPALSMTFVYLPSWSDSSLAHYCGHCKKQRDSDIVA